MKRMSMQSAVKTISRRCGAVVLPICLAYGAQALGQETPDPGPTAEADEEVIVIGQNPGALRERIRLATDAVYAKFNEINSDDSFDIHCSFRPRTGSRMLVRVCESNYWRDAQADAGEETARAMQGASSFNPDTIYASARLKSQEMSQEVYRLMLENAEFKQTLSELGALVLEARKDRPGATQATVLTEGYLGEGLLPYGAATAAQVRVGRRAWKYELTHRTFAFGSLNGAIEAIELSCKGLKEQLVYEGGAEWTLPDDWRSCELRVDAEPQTSFAFYEFE
jgi:hypothetical protein